MKPFLSYWYLWGLLLLVIGFLVAKNWNKIFGKKDTTAALKLLRSCKRICNDKYTTAVNGCNQYPEPYRTNCINTATREWDMCLGKCK